MANTYTQIVIHTVIVVSERHHMIRPPFRDAVHKYMSGILRSHAAFPYAVGGWMDHVHLLFELPANVALSQLIGQTKASTSNFINENKWLNHKFKWQEGYAAFSCSKNHRSNVADYIMKQEEHHRKVSFREEYLAFMQEEEIEFDERYVFKFF